MFNIRIEHKTPDKTILNEFDITLNKINTNDESNLKDTNEDGVDIIPPRHRSNAEIKRDLDNFAMERKKSHLTTVEFNVRNYVNIEVTESVKTKKYIRELSNTISAEDYNMFKRPEVESVMKKQTELVEKLTKVLLRERIILGPALSNLLDDVERLKNRSATLKQEVIKPSIKPNSIFNIDETAVRNALKMDPFVKRVLQMGKSKRDAYEKEAKSYLKERNSKAKS